MTTCKHNKNGFTEVNQGLFMGRDSKQKNFATIQGMIRREVFYIAEVDQLFDALMVSYNVADMG